MPTISVIIPVFKAEKYIEKCARTLFEQTLDDVEFIFIDDGSPDASIEILKRVIGDYPTRKVRLRIQPLNLGVAAARQAGLSLAKGDYIIHCDPDDWVEADWLEKLYNEACSSDADLVSCDFIFEYDEDSKYHPECPDALTPESMRKGVVRNVQGGCCNKLISSKLIFDNKIEFVQDINYQEDLLFVYKVLCHSRKISHVDEGLYHYNKTNESSISSNPSLERIKKKFVVKLEIDKAETDDEIRRGNGYHLCKGYEIVELWIAPNVSNKEFKEFLKPFYHTIWKRKDLKFIWKFLAASSYFGIGAPLRSLYRSLKR